MINRLHKIVLALLVALCFTSAAEAKVYIDVVAAPRVMPIAVQPLAGQGGVEVSSVIADDLLYTGLFSVADPLKCSERPEEGFSAARWSALGVEAVVKGFVKDGTVTVYLYDVLEDRVLMQKLYRADQRGMRPVGHQAAADIYEKITGEHAAFTSQLAYVAGRSGSKSLRICDWDGKNVRQAGKPSQMLVSPHWAPDGTKLIFSANRSGTWGIYMYDLRTAQESAVYSTDGICIAGDFFPSGDEFTLSSSMMGTADIYVYSLKSKLASRLTTDRGIEVTPSVSPDGGTIAYVSDRSGVPQVYSMDRLGYNSARLTFTGSYNTSPVWSPRGDKIAFSGRFEGKNQIFVMNSDGSKPVRLTDRGNNEDPTFSPDGRFIAFTSDREGPKAVYVMRADGSGAKKISYPGESASSPRWSGR